MTAKRFVKFNITANDDYTIQNGVKDSVTGEWYHTIDNKNAKRLCGLLNELHEENMMLKGAVAYYKLMLMSLEEEAKRMSQIHCKGDVE